MNIILGHSNEIFCFTSAGGYLLSENARKKTNTDLSFPTGKKVLSIIGSIWFFCQIWIAITFDYCKHKRTSTSFLPECRTYCNFNVEPFHHALRWCNDIYKCSRSWQMLDRLVCNQRISQFLLKQWRSQVLTWSHCFYLDVHILYMLLFIENFSGINLLNLS